MPTLLAAPTRLLIPRIFHRIWLGKPPPEEVIQFGQTWQEHHPDWEMKLWTEESLPPLQNRELFDEATTFAGKADIARYEILEQFGGVYLDTDFECLKNIEPLLADVEAFAASEDGTLVSIGILGARPHHGFFRAVVAALPQVFAATRGQPPNVRSGPVFLTALHNHLAANGGPTIKVFPPSLFYPYHWTERYRKGEAFPNAFAVHHWDASWLKAGSSAPAVPVGNAPVSGPSAPTAPPPVRRPASAKPAVLIEIDPEHVPDLHVTVSAALQLFAPIKSIQIVFQVPTEPRLETAMALKQLCISVCPEGSSLPEIVLLPASTTSEMLTLCRVQAGGDAVSSAAAIIKMCAARDAMLPKAAPPPPPPTSAPSTAVDPSRQLPAEGTFFRHLLEQGRRNAEGTGASPETHRSERMPTSVPALLSFYAQALQHIQPERVLDVGVGFGGWAMLVREICDERQGRIHRENWRVRVEAVTSAPHDVEEYHHFFYDSIHVGEPLEVMSRLDGSWELVVLGHEHFTDPALTGPLLDRALVAGAYVIATTPIRPENDGSRTGELGLVELLERDPLRYQVSPDERTAAFLFSAYDPLCLRPDAPEAVFERIFNDNSWGERESRSGPGSSLAQTATLRRELPALLAKVGAHSVLDAPCGDWNWMRHVDLGPLKYVGADIVPRLVAENRARWGSPHRRFLVLDITADTLPQVDVIICRDALVHLSFDDAARAVANFCRSRSTYLLTTTFPNHRPNAPAATGEWRPLNLELGPFFFPAPIAVLNEDCTEGDGTYADKSLGLWLLEDLRQ